MKTYNIGIMGCGNIATTMANTLKNMPNVNCYAVASRNIEKAKNFKNNYNFEVAYGSYEELVKDSNVDLVYIATPHSEHYNNALLCLTNNKHVLCEKAFMANLEQTKKILQLAKEKKLLIAEAMWVRYMPLTHKLTELLNNKVIGEIKTIKADLYYSIANIPRISNPNLAGGALLDVGVYPISFLTSVTNKKISKITSECTKFETGVDKQTIINIKFEDDSYAMLTCGSETIGGRTGFIYGTNGYITIDNINNFNWIKIYNNNFELINEYQKPQQITGFEYQVQECIDAIENKHLETKSMPHYESIRIMEICDEVRRLNNIKYPFE